MNDDEFEKLMEARFPPITVLYPRTGDITTYERKVAQREIAYGSAVETIPADPERARTWLAELRERVVAEWDARTDKKSYRDHEQPWPVFHDYEAWCAENGTHALPADEAKVVRWLLERVASGMLEISNVSRWASVVADFHHLTRHPPEHLARPAISAFNRAIGFAKARLRGAHRNIHEIPSLAPAKAFEMFPTGVVPQHYHEIAA